MELLEPFLHKNQVTRGADFAEHLGDSLRSHLECPGHSFASTRLLGYLSRCHARAGVRVTPLT